MNAEECKSGLHRLPVQTPVLNRLGEVLLADMLTAFEVGDGPGDLEDAGEGAGRKAEPVGDQFQHPVAGGVQFAVFPEVAGVHLGVAVDLLPLLACMNLQYLLQ